jgi:uncharacterized protein YaiE (UPF0345 family)
MSADRFENATVVKKANVYYDGRVTSRTVLLADGSRRTLGVMLAGDYEFSTGAPELMEVLGGEMKVLLPGDSQWKTFKEGQSYEVAGNASFKLRIDGVADYCCTYG